MLLVASDLSTEVYFYFISDGFREARSNGANVEFDEESWVQLFSAPLCLGYYAICHAIEICVKIGEDKWGCIICAGGQGEKSATSTYQTKYS